MRLKDLIDGYKFNKIEAEISEEYNNETEKAGVILFRDGIAASYLLDENSTDVISMIMFINTLTKDKLTINNQINYTIYIINLLKITIKLNANLPEKEVLMILKTLGLFDESFKDGKRIKHLDNCYEIQVKNGILQFSIYQDTPLQKVDSKIH